MHMQTYTNTCVELNLCGVLFLFYGSNSFIKVTMLVLALSHKKLPPYCTKYQHILSAFIKTGRESIVNLRLFSSSSYSR